jgi:hypothetical protein
MYAYSQLLLAELHLQPRPHSHSLSTSRRAAQRFAQLEALRERAERSRPVAPALRRRVRRTLAPGTTQV